MPPNSQNTRVEIAAAAFEIFKQEYAYKMILWESESDDKWIIGIILMVSVLCINIPQPQYMCEMNF